MINISKIVGISKKTFEAIEKNSNAYSDRLKKSIEILLNLSNQFSPLSDANYLLKKLNISLEDVRLPSNGDWIPIRNVIRIIAKLGDLTQTKINSFDLVSMKCGCDYFEGEINAVSEENQIKGGYRWQWTAFSEMKRYYDNFIEFPQFKRLNYIENV